MTCEMQRNSRGMITPSSSRRLDLSKIESGKIDLEVQALDVRACIEAALVAYLCFKQVATSILRPQLETGYLLLY